MQLWVQHELCGGFTQCVRSKALGSVPTVTKPDGMAAFRSFGTGVGADGPLSRALGPAKENNYALESNRWVYGGVVVRCWELKSKFRTTDNRMICAGKATSAAKLLSFQLALLALLSAGVFGGSKEDAARDLLAKSFRQTNLWTDGPVKLVANVVWRHGPVKTVANVTMPRPKNQDLNLTYEISWAGPDKWRAEWSGPGYSRITVLNSGKLYRSSNLPAPPLAVLQFEKALGALNGNSPEGPWISPPLDLSKSKMQISNEKVGKTNAKCVSLAVGTWCIDPVSGHALSSRNLEEGTFEYNDYVKVGEVEFPQSLRMTFGADVQQESTISISRGITFADSLFAAPPNSTPSDFPSCADMDKTSLPGHLDKKVQPRFPETAHINGHFGTVWLYATVGKDGAIQLLRVINGSWPELDKSAMEAVQQWKYSPYTRCGQPVEVETVIVINFFKGS